MSTEPDALFTKKPWKMAKVESGYVIGYPVSADRYAYVIGPVSAEVALWLMDAVEAQQTRAEKAADPASGTREIV